MFVVAFGDPDEQMSQTDRQTYIHTSIYTHTYTHTHTHTHTNKHVLMVAVDNPDELETICLFVCLFRSSVVQAICLYWYPRAGMNSQLSYIPTEARSI